MYTDSDRGTKRTDGFRINDSASFGARKKTQGIKGAGKLLPEVFPQFSNSILLFHYLMLE